MTAYHDEPIGQFTGCPVCQGSTRLTREKKDGHWYAIQACLKCSWKSEGKKMPPKKGK